MAAISETLRQARLRSGVDLDRLADKTKINLRYLQAIEAGDFGKLPSGIFARMFIKQYADALGLDGASFAQEFQRSLAFGDSGPDIQPVAETGNHYQPRVSGLSPASDGARNDRIASMLSSLIWVVAAILVCAGAYYGLAHLPSRSNGVADAQAPAKVSTETRPQESTPATQLATQPANPQNPGPASHEAPANSAGPMPESSAPIQLAIRTSERVWVTATADGKTVIAELLPAGSSKIVTATRYARLTLGNAGGADITFNGKKLDPIGPQGMVRTVEFTPQSAQVVSRTSPSAAPPPNPDPLR